MRNCIAKSIIHHCCLLLVICYFFLHSSPRLLAVDGANSTDKQAIEEIEGMRVVIDTLTCVGVPITLFWPINAPTPTIWTELIFTSPGESLICQNFPSPYPHSECWNVKVYPEPPPSRFRIQLLDTTATGDINYIVCIWEAGTTIERICFPICRVMRVECGMSVEICADNGDTFTKGDKKGSAQHCITLENFDCVKPSK